MRSETPTGSGRIALLIKELFLIVLVGLTTRGSIAAQSSLETVQIDGTCNTRSWDAHQIVIESLPFEFHLILGEEGWSIRVVDTEVRAGKRQSWDYAETFYDGTDIYRVVHFTDAVRKVAQVADTYGIYGQVGKKNFPHGATPVEKVLWLVFCAEHYPSLSLSNFPPMSASLQSTNVGRIDVKYTTIRPRLVKSLKAWVNGVYIQNEHHPSGQVFRLPPPFDQGYQQLEVESALNEEALETAPLVSKAVASFYEIDSSLRPPKRYLGTQIEISVQKVTKSVQNPHPPALTETASITDTRFTNAQGFPFLYVESSGTWVSRSVPDPAHLLAQKPKLRVLGSPPVTLEFMKTHKSPWIRAVFILLLLSPLVFVGINLLRRLAVRRSKQEE